MKSVPPIAFDHRASPTLVAALLIAGVLAAVSLATSDIPSLLKTTVMVIAAGYFGVSLWRFVIRAPKRVVWQSTDTWRLVDRRRGESDAQLIRATARGEWLLIELRRMDRSRVALVLTRDNTDAETRRALRVRLSRNTTA